MSAVMESEESQHKPETWKCPRCGNVIKTFVPLSATPTCHNPAKHNHKKFDMEKIK